MLVRDSTGSFFPFGYGSLSASKVVLGLDPNYQTNGFVGSIRNFKLFSQYYSDSVIWNIQFVYIIPTRYLLIQILMNDVGDFINSAGRSSGYIVGNQ